MNKPMKLTLLGWTVEILNPTRGCFEKDSNGTGGCLLFKDHKLFDYDGVYELPEAVKDAIVALGFGFDGDRDDY